MRRWRDPAGRWVELSPIGQGSAGEVLRARGDEGEAALKWIADPVLRAQELAVARRLAPRWMPALQGQVTLLEAELGRCELLRYAWIDGVSADALPPAGAAERLVRAWWWLHGVGRALQELHDAGVAHGDVKPANVLWRGAPDAPPAGADDAPEGARAVLLDLSAATPFGAALRGLTPHYAAPELQRGAAPSAASDVFALALAARELLGAPAPAHAEVRAWVDAALQPAPGQRPSAQWLADQAASALGLVASAPERQARHRQRVRAGYLRARSEELASSFSLSPSVTGTPRAWLEPLASAGPDAASLGPLSGWQRAQWIAFCTGLLGDPHSTSWSDHELADALWEGWPAASQPSPGVAAEPLPPWPECALELERYAAALEAHPGEMPAAVRLALSQLLLRRGELARAQLQLARLGDEPAVRWLQAECARRAGQPEQALSVLAPLAHAPLAPGVRLSVLACRARAAWDRGDAAQAWAWVSACSDPVTAEVRALCAWSQGDFRRAVATCDEALAAGGDALARARWLGTRALARHALGEAALAAEDFAQAEQLATLASARAEQASFATGLAAASADAGKVQLALEAATRAALLWQGLGQPARSARAHISRSQALLLLGADVAAREAASQARADARLGGDELGALYAELAWLEGSGLGAAEGEALARGALERAERLGGDPWVFAAARAWAWPPLHGSLQRAEQALPDAGEVARADYWAHVLRHGPAKSAAQALAPLESALQGSLPVSVRWAALDAICTYWQAREPDRAAPWRARRSELAAAVRDGLRADTLATFDARWGDALQRVEGGFVASEQWHQLERLSRLLLSGDSPEQLCDQVLDALLLWTSAERGLLLLVDDDEPSRLRVQSARNVEGAALAGAELRLSHSLAERAWRSGELVIEHNALVGESAASVHALQLRSVLAVPLRAQGRDLGVLYLDDRGRTHAFSGLDRAWLQAMASQVATALHLLQQRRRSQHARERAERAERALSEQLQRQAGELASLRERVGQQLGRQLLGDSPVMQQLRARIARVAPSPLPVLVRGESGTGKELVARALHEQSARAERAFISENCAAVPEALLESTLFGHERGAFTGAVGSRVGLFEMAHGGTLFLDEVGEMSPALQAKLLRVLETGEVWPLGAPRLRTVDVRVVAATHRDLQAMVAAGAFREDLWFRLAVVELEVPPLRARREDIPQLVTHFMAQYGEGLPRTLSAAALDRLQERAWPGNVRQLQNVLRRALLLGDTEIVAADVDDPEPARVAPERPRKGTLRAQRDALSRERVLAALGRHHGNRTRAAAELGMSRYGLHKLIARLQLEGELAEKAVGDVEF